MKMLNWTILKRVLLGTVMLLPVLGFTNINIGVNNQVNTGTIVGGDCVRGNGNTKAETRQVDSFNSLEIDGIFEVSVTCGKEQQVGITADSNLHAKISTLVENGRLQVSTNGAICTQNPMVLNISLKELAAIRVDGSSELIVSANNCTVESFLVDLRGTSSMKLSGSGKTVNIKLQGTSELDGSQFEAQNVTVRTEDATEAVILVTEKLSASSSGTSEVVYGGNPPVVEVNSSDASEIGPSS